MLEEQLQQQELGLRQLDQPLAAVDLVGDRVEHQVGVAQHLAVAVVRCAAQQRAQPRLQLAQRERLDEVVVGADVEPLDAVVDRVARGQHQDRRAVAGRAQPPAHLQPVDPGHRHVEDDRVGRPLRRARRAPRAPSAASVHLVALEPQRPLERPPHRGLVIDHQHRAPLPGMIAAFA